MRKVALVLALLLAFLELALAARIFTWGWAVCGPGRIIVTSQGEVSSVCERSPAPWIVIVNGVLPFAGGAVATAGLLLARHHPALARAGVVTGAILGLALGYYLIIVPLLMMGLGLLAIPPRSTPSPRAGPHG